MGEATDATERDDSSAVCGVEPAHGGKAPYPSGSVRTGYGLTRSPAFLPGENSWKCGLEFGQTLRGATAMRDASRSARRATAQLLTRAWTGHGLPARDRSRWNDSGRLSLPRTSSPARLLHSGTALGPLVANDACLLARARTAGRLESTATDQRIRIRLHTEHVRPRPSIATPHVACTDDTVPHMSAFAIRSIGARTSGSILGRPPLRRPRHVQYLRNPARCQAMTVAGLTMISVSFQRAQLRERNTQSPRSALVSRGRLTERSSTPSRWRRARSSTANRLCVRNKANAAKSHERPPFRTAAEGDLAVDRLQ